MLGKPVYGVILAGGQGSRMQYRHKPLLRLAGKPLIEHVIALAAPQVSGLVISVNDPPADYGALGIPLIPDPSASRQGPLVGICSAVHWYREREHRNGYLACFPADVPVFPTNLVATLISALQPLPTQDGASNTDNGEERVIWCRTGDQIQPLFSLWPLSILPRLDEAVRAGVHGPRLFFATCPNTMVQLPEPEPPLFFNINTPEDLAEAERLMVNPRR